MGSQPSPHDNWIANGHTCINKTNDTKTCTHSLPLKKTQCYFLTLKHDKENNDNNV